MKIIDLFQKENVKRYPMIVLLSLVLWTAFASPVAANNKIVGGKRIGPVELGQPLEKYRQFLGPQKTINPNFFDYPDRKLAVMVKNGIVEGVVTYSPHYKTDKGVAVGASIKVLNEKYGNYLKTNTGALIYTDLGLAFNEKDYKISRIMVVPASPDPLLGDKRIIPGDRAGNIRIGMEISQIVSHWGEPTTKEQLPNSKYSLYKYNHKGVLILVESGIVAGVRILSYLYQTPEGISVNNTRDQVEKTYGKRYTEVQSSIDYKSLGIGFYFHEGKVMEILLTPRSE